MLPNHLAGLLEHQWLGPGPGRVSDSVGWGWGSRMGISTSPRPCCYYCQETTLCEPLVHYNGPHPGCTAEACGRLFQSCSAGPCLPTLLFHFIYHRSGLGVMVPQAHGLASFRGHKQDKLEPLHNLRSTHHLISSPRHPPSSCYGPRCAKSSAFS